MVNHDVYAAIAALLHPLPDAPTSEEAQEAGAPYEMWMEGHSEALSQTSELRAQTAEELRLAVDVSDEPADPLLIALERERRAKEMAEERIRALIAYGREFTEPRPYRLADLADAAGMSVSGVRTAYSVRTVTAVAEDIGINPRGFQAADTDPPPTPTTVEILASNGLENSATDPVASWGITDGADVFVEQVSYSDNDEITDALARFQAAGLLAPGRARVVKREPYSDFWVHEDHQCRYRVEVTPT